MMLFWGKKWKEVHIFLSFFTLFDTDTKSCINLKIQIYSFLIFKNLIYVNTMQVPIYTFEFSLLFGLYP